MTGRQVMRVPARLAVAERTERTGRPRAAAARTWSGTRLGTTTTMAALVGVTVIIVAVAAAHSPGASRATSPQATAAIANVAVAPAAVAPAAAGRGPVAKPASVPAHGNTVSLVLTATDRSHCPATAVACVDLTRHITWLQAHGTVTFGPVQMEPGEPGSRHQTPRGTFRVAWKAGPTYRSTIYHTPMPWATFFAAGGIAFHGGSLTVSSHGCVHLTDANARYYSEHLPIGAQVVVF